MEEPLTLDQEGGYMLEALESATKISLDDDSSVDVVHLGSLTSGCNCIRKYPSSQTPTTMSVLEIHLHKLVRNAHP